MGLALERRNLGIDAAMRLLDDATAAIQYNRDLLHATIENVRTFALTLPNGYQVVVLADTGGFGDGPGLLHAFAAEVATLVGLRR